MSWLRRVMPATILAVAGVSRLQPHPPNFTPIGAIVLFGGAHFASRWEAFLVPLAAMVFSDAIMAGTGWHRSYMSALP